MKKWLFLLVLLFILPKNVSATTYYVSADGTGDGTISNPMSYDEVSEKKYFSGDKILLKGGDTFYGTLDLDISTVDSNITTLGSYGNGRAYISGAKIVNDSWSLYQNNIYRVDLTDLSMFDGLKTNNTNIGFLEDNNGKKYYSKVNSLKDLKNEYDFYCDSKYIYIKSSTNPYEKLGSLRLATKTKLVILKSNLTIDNIMVGYTGGHALATSGYNDIENVTIKNCVIENIGGSYLKGTTRYGNGIQFYRTNTRNVVIKDNIIRNVYDVAFTIQGESGSGNNIKVYNNVMVNNSQDSEIWESGSATGVKNYEYYSNISINQGRGWGYNARPDKYCAGAILFWGYLIKDTKITFSNNLYYNPRRIYFIEGKNGTINLFKDSSKISSDNNIFYLRNDVKLFREEGDFNTTSILVDKYNKDYSSIFNPIDDDFLTKLTKISNTNSISKIRDLLKSILVEDIEVSTLPKKTTYVKETDDLDISLGKLTITYKILPNETISLTKNMINNFNNNQLGSLALNVSYLGKNTSFNIKIVDKPKENTSEKTEVKEEPKVVKKETKKEETKIVNKEVKKEQVKPVVVNKVVEKDKEITKAENDITNNEVIIESSRESSNFFMDYVRDNGIGVYMLCSLIVLALFMKFVS